MKVQFSVSPLGALVGALVGGLLRPTVLYLFLNQPLKPDEYQIVLGFSALLGVGVGVLAGMIGKPLASALVGGLLATVTYAMSAMPLMFCLCLHSLEHGKGSGTLPPVLAMACTGVVSGLAGGLAEWISSRNKKPPPSDQASRSAPAVWVEDTSAEPEPPADNPENPRAV